MDQWLGTFIYLKYPFQTELLLALYIFYVIDLDWPLHPRPWPHIGSNANVTSSLVSYRQAKTPILR